MGITAWASRSSIGPLAVGLLTIAGPAVRANEAPAPRYRLTAGRELTYRSESRSVRKDGETVYKVDWKAWAVGRDPDGAWRLVLRCDLATGAPGSEGRQDADPADTLVWRCRLFDDGRLVGATTMGTVRDPFRLFPRLPDGPDHLEHGWDSAGPEREQVRFHYRLASKPDPDDSALVIAMEGAGPQDKVYLTSHKSRATFDTRRGVVTRVETEDTSGYSFAGVTRGTIELVADEDRGPAWAAEFGREADAYFAAIESYEAATGRAGRDAGRCRAILDEAKATLDGARAAVRDPALRASLDQKLAGHAQSTDDLAKEAADREARLGQPAADWEAADLDGQAHRLADYRERVVVLDFWYRGCGWCMHAMPRVNRLAESFRGEPVSVLGMTIDKDEADARVVVEAMGLTYPAIRAAGIPEKFGVRGYPTLVVIDPRGLVREIHVGYSPRLFESISEVIRGLLDEAGAD